MTNPFEAFNISDDEETYQPAATEQKVKRTHQEKKAYKQQQLEVAKKATTASNAPLNESLPERTRDNAKDVRDKRGPPTPYTKKLGEGHFHDRRSGTGRVYFFYHLGTGPEKKAEDGATSATSRTSSTKTNTLRKLPRARPPRSPRLESLEKKQNPQLK